MDKQSLGSALRAARRASGLNEFEAADRAGVTRAWISSVELDRINRPDHEKLKRLARIYGINPSVFLKLAGYDVDEEAMPERREVDLIFELLLNAMARAKQRGEIDNTPKELESLAAKFGLKNQRSREPILV